MVLLERLLRRPAFGRADTDPGRLDQVRPAVVGCAHGSRVVRGRARRVPHCSARPGRPADQLIRRALRWRGERIIDQGGGYCCPSADAGEGTVTRGTAGWVGGLVTAMVVAGACAVGPVTDDGGPGPQEPGPGVTSQDETTRADRSTNVEDFKKDINDAVRSAETYWSAQFRASGERFQPVRRIIPYAREGEVACGGQPLPRDNAVYCSAGDFIAYDVNWAVAAFRQIGDAFLYYLLGHEYAHGVQIRLGIRYSYTIEQELQADCMAGAYLGGSVQAGVLELEDGDLEEFREGLLAVGDDPGQPWFAEGAHGTAEQRTQAFFTGYEKTLSACDLG
ncbi:neutral zinc metallopeptidase [Micromonospora sp. WMMD882]|uniref:neutral zinc metallopeptidase n=1 Tax=Micromonospora sp. WMMD882 TaxID=3015151 RepID=UPI00248C252A|nr:neutral zinc metallopeptidase [Micromonospora sp. WMMD882]WBB81119.1 neutral zinc metallopeptidase [Micromonospora sp. WMMD882]